MIMRRPTASKASKKNANKDQDNSDNGVDIDVQICDVAMAVQVTKAEANLYQDHPLFDWTHVPFLAPEVALKLPYSFPCDYWALGVLLFMMISAHMPFHVDDPMDRALLLQKIKDAEYSVDNLPVWQSTRAEIKHLIRHLLQSDPLSRINVSEMRRNVWMVQG